MSQKHNPHCFMGVDIRGKVRLQYRHFSDVVKHFHRQFSAARKLSEILKRKRHE